MNVAFVGLGRMGMPMARAVARAGFPLTVYNRSRERTLSLLDDVTATEARTPAEAAAASDVIITMLADGDAVGEVMRGRDGLLWGAREGSVFIEMSTVGPNLARSFADGVARGGSVMLDAPVSGSVALAESGTLTTLVGGDHETFDRARPVLAAMTQKQLWLGVSGAGAAMKLGLNGLIAATNHAIAEALVVADCSGIARDAAYDAIASSAVSSPYVSYKRDAFVSPSDEPVAFTLTLLQKDLKLYGELARQLRVPLVTAPAIRDALDDVRASQGDDADLSAVAEALRRKSIIAKAPS